MSFIIEKPLSFEDFKTLRSNSNCKVASHIIKSLNGAIKRRETFVKNWSKRPERVEVLSLVAEEFKKVGWQGIVQRKNKDLGNYGIYLMPPGCECNGKQECDTCKEGSF